LYHFARRLEYGKVIGQDVSRAGKYYHLFTELNSPSAQNSFEQEIGIQSNLSLVAHDCQVAALQDHPNGANYLGFCLEYGGGVQQNIGLASEYSRFAADRGHPEDQLNYRHCLRLLGRWEVLDRSSEDSAHPPSHDDLAAFSLTVSKSPMCSRAFPLTSSLQLNK
jgi:TPR repeat protein